MNAASHDPDIRVGDLVKATNRAIPENVATFRVFAVEDRFIASASNTFMSATHDFEVLDRPLPPISEELLFGAVEAYRKTRGFRGPVPAGEAQDYRTALSAVINLTREYDRNNNKENA